MNNETSTTAENTLTPNIIVCIIAIVFLVLCGIVGYVIHCIKTYRIKTTIAEDSTSMETDESFDEK